MRACAVLRHLLASRSGQLAFDFRIEAPAAKVNGIKITGWQEVLGTPTTLELERKAYAWLRSTHDYQEGVTAFLEKRSPRFTGS